jgi:uncharacterized small protein (DUF1192 family)
MSKPVLDAFFLGRAFAEAIQGKLEEGLTNALSELGKFDAEQRERLRQFTEEVRVKAEREIQKNSQASSNSGTTGNSSADIQEIIDELRAEIARLRSELQTYRNSKA